MAKKKRQLSLNEYLQNMIDVISESIEEDPQLLKEALKEEGINHEQLVNEGLQLIHKLEREQRLAQAKERREKFLKFFRSIQSMPDTRTRQELLEALRSDFGEELAVLHHKLESIEDEDLRKIIEEAKRLKLFEEELKSQ